MPRYMYIKFHFSQLLSKFIFRFPFYICKTLYLSALKKLQFKNKKQTFFTYIIHWSNSPKAPHLGLILKIQLSIKVDNSKNVLYKFTEYRLTVPDLSLSRSSFSIAVSIFAAIRAFSWEKNYTKYMNSIML